MGTLGLQSSDCSRCAAPYVRLVTGGASGLGLAYAEAVGAEKAGRAALSMF